MPYPSNSGRSQTVRQFLAQKAQAAYQESIQLSKAALSKDERRVVNEIIERHIVAGLELGKPSAKIDENKPNVASVTWAVTGTTDLVGLFDSQNNQVETSSKTLITRDLEYQTPIGNSEQLQQEIKARIASITDSINRHFLLVNADITEHNRHLRDSVPGWVNGRMKVVRGAKSAEDFLNS